MWEAFYPSERLEEWDSLKPTDSDPYCLCTAHHLQWEVRSTGTQTNMHTQTQTHTQRFQAAYAVFTIRELGWKSRFQWSWNWICMGLCGCMCEIFYLHPLSEAWTWPTGFLEDTWALFILAVSSPWHVICQARKCWTFHLCCVLTPCRHPMLELHLYVYLVVEVEVINSIL